MSTMRIVTPNGAIKEVEKLCLMVEKRFMFNNHERRALEEAESLAEKPTAISLTFASSNAMFGVFGNDLFIGNLKPETVVEIQQSLLKDGFYDFGGMEYQRVKDFSKTTFDHGKSLPYTSAFSMPFNGGLVGVDSILRSVPCLERSTMPPMGLACPVHEAPLEYDDEDDYEDDYEDDGEDDGGEDE